MPPPSELHFEVERLRSQLQSARRRIGELETAVEALTLRVEQIACDNEPTRPYNERPVQQERPDANTEADNAQ